MRARTTQTRSLMSMSNAGRVPSVTHPKRDEGGFVIRIYVIRVYSKYILSIFTTIQECTKNTLQNAPPQGNMYIPDLECTAECTERTPKNIRRLTIFRRAPGPVGAACSLPGLGLGPAPVHDRNLRTLRPFRRRAADSSLLGLRFRRRLLRLLRRSFVLILLLIL